MKNTDRIETLVVATIVTIIAIIVCTKTVKAKEFSNEKEYQNAWCQHQVEYVLPDKTRVDCLTPVFAIEFDYAHKWAEAIGQSIHYGMQTNRRPGIVLIVEKESDMKHWKRMQDIIWYYRLPVQTWMLKNY